MHKLSCPHCEFIFLGDDPPEESCPACGEDWMLATRQDNSHSAENPLVPAAAAIRETDKPDPGSLPAPREFRPEPVRGGWSWMLVVLLFSATVWLWWERSNLQSSLRRESQDRQQAESQLKLTHDRLSGAARVLAETREELQKVQSQYNTLSERAAGLETVVQEERSRRESMETIFQGIWQKSGRSFVRNWQLIGPFAYPESGQVSVVPGDLKIGEHREGRSGTVRWKPFESEHDRLNLDQFFEVREPALCYCATWVYSDLTQDVWLSIGSDDGVVCWVNGEQVHNNQIQRSGSPGQDKVEAVLNRGWNEILFKVDNQGGGEWNLHLEFLKEKDNKSLKLFSTHLPQIRSAEVQTSR